MKYGIAIWKIWRKKTWIETGSDTGLSLCNNKYFYSVVGWFEINLFTISSDSAFGKSSPTKNAVGDSLLKILLCFHFCLFPLILISSSCRTLTGEEKSCISNIWTLTILTFLCIFIKYMYPYFMFKDGDIRIEFLVRLVLLLPIQLSNTWKKKKNVAYRISNDQCSLECFRRKMVLRCHKSVILWIKHFIGFMISPKH